MGPQGGRSHRRKSHGLHHQIERSIVKRDRDAVCMEQRDQRVLGACKPNARIADIDPNQVFGQSVKLEKGAQPKPTATAHVKDPPAGQSFGNRAYQRAKGAHLLRS